MHRLRSAGRTTGATAAALVALTVAAMASYTVEPGDTLSDIAAAHGTTVRAVAAANGILDTHRILAGQRLRLPGAGSGPDSGALHTVALGEHLSGVAARYGVSAAEIGRANDLGDLDRVRAGTQLRIPGAAAAAAAAPRAATRAEVESLLETTARAHGWSPAFVKALAWQESGWNNGLVSSAGAVGIMQVLPETGAFVSRNLAGHTLDLEVPADNVLAGVLFLDHLHQLTGGDAEATLAGYYQGLRSVRENGRYRDTERYVANVLALRERFR